jgi:hypothetical protein
VRARSKVEIQQIQSGHSWPPFKLAALTDSLFAVAVSKWALGKCGQGATWLKIRRGISRRRYLFRCSTTELPGSKPWQESNLRPSESEGTFVFTTGEA